jgi:L-threonylcarbamoyladenylate synthase
MTRLLALDAENPEPALIEEAAEVIQRGGLIAYPTETFYALGADALNQSALNRLFELKGRSREKVVSVIVASRAMLAELAAEIAEQADILADRFWPGPLTLILKAKPGLPQGIVSAQGAIAARVSSHPVAHRLTNILGRALTATSANLTGKEEPTSAGQVVDSFTDKIDLILDAGPTPGGKASTLVDLTGKSARILRPGAISEADIRSALGKGE